MVKRALWGCAVVGGVVALAAVLAFTCDRWVATTSLPPLEVETSVEVLARDGRLLRAFTVADGRWRLGVAPERVDPDYLDLLLAFEDKRFYRHAGVDPLALARAAPVGGGAGRRCASAGESESDLVIKHFSYQPL